jgi:hypothetical protein
LGTDSVDKFSGKLRIDLGALEFNGQAYLPQREHLVYTSSKIRGESMGKFASPSGVTVYQYDGTGAGTSSQFFPCSKFEGAARPQCSTAGSTDWLRDIYLADTNTALNDLIKQFPPPTSGPVRFLTSGASLGAYLISSLQGQTQKKPGPFVIATNSNPLEPNETNQLHVSPVDPESLPDSILSKLWKLEKTRLQVNQQTPRK